MRRVGVQFTGQQKQEIQALLKKNDVLGAQKIILKELAREFGGSANAQVNTFQGSIQQLGNSLNNIGESIGY